MCQARGMTSNILDFLCTITNDARLQLGLDRSDFAVRPHDGGEGPEEGDNTAI